MNKNHDDNCDCCKNGLEDTIARQAKWMEKHGWYSHCIVEDAETSTGFDYHTHGVDESTGHLDIQCILPINQSVLQSIIGSIIDRIKTGETFVVDQVYSNILEDYDVVFAKAKEGGREVLRLILPDQNNNLMPGSFEPGSIYAKQWLDVLEQTLGS